MSNIHNYLNGSMTVGELRDELNRFDPKSPVLFAHTAKDYWRSHLAERIEGISESDVFYSQYHETAQEFEQGSVSANKDDDVLTVVVIR